MKAATPHGVARPDGGREEDQVVPGGQSGALSLVEECRGSALIGLEVHSVALLCHKEPAQGTQSPLLFLAFRWFFMS